MPVDANGNPTAPVTVVPGEGDARTRDLIGRMDARLTAVEALNKEQAEELAWFKMMEGEQEPARQPVPAAPPQAAPVPAPHPLPQLPTAPVYPPQTPPAPVYASQAAANAPQLYYQDPTTGQLRPYSAAPMPAPVAPPMRIPAATAPAPTPPASPRAASPEQVRWQKAYDSLADDLEFYGKMHPKVADKKAAEIIREAVTSGDLNAVLRAHAKEEPMLRAVIQERIAEDAKAAGLVMPAAVVEPVPGTPEARKPGEPYVSAAEQVAVASKNTATPMKAPPAPTAPVAKVTPAEATIPVAKVPTVTPTSPPLAADETKGLVVAAKDTTQHIDEAFG